MEPRLIVLAAVLGFTAVAAGAFGAHGLESRFADRPDLRAVYRTGAEYHLIHALAVLGVAALAARRPARPLAVAAGLFSAGVVLFSGSLYALAISGERWLGAVTPVGGVSFLAGWVALGLSVRSRGPALDHSGRGGSTTASNQ